MSSGRAPASTAAARVGRSSAAGAQASRAAAHTSELATYLARLGSTATWPGPVLGLDWTGNPEELNVSAVYTHLSHQPERVYTFCSA